MRSKKAPNAAASGKPSAVPLSRNVEKHLLAYAAAASAGLLSIASPAEAQIVYTPSNMPMAEAFDGGGPALTQLDVNNDRNPDFVFTNFTYSTHGFGNRYLNISPGQPGNEILGIQSNGRLTAAALPAGVQVGPNGNFQSEPNGITMASVAHNNGTQTTSPGGAWGSWLKVETAFVGLKFLVNGEVHYGWARVKFVGPGAFGTGSIYGYAYESTPNQPIVTGQTTGPTKKGSAGKPGTAAMIGPSVQMPTSLGLLATGAPGVGMWRGPRGTDGLK